MVKPVRRFSAYKGRIADLIKRGQSPLEYFVYHIFPHNLLGQNVVISQSQFGEPAHLQLAIKVMQRLGELQHNLGAFLLGLIYQRCDP